METQSATDPVVTARTKARTVRAMVLDDSRFDIEHVARCLRTMETLQVEVSGCATVQEALDHLISSPVDILFIDYSLENQTGPEALRALREGGLVAPAILLTGMRGESVVLEAMHAGIVDYIPKDAVSPNAVHRATQNAIEKADLQREVMRANAELSNTVRSLRLRQEEVESFYHNVSHELKTPLTGAREFVSLVIDGAAGKITEEQADLLGAAVRNCDQMVTCINDMLDASRIETGKLMLRSEVADLRSVIQDSLRSLGRAASAADVGVVLRCQAQPITLPFDPQRIYQVVTNLVGNAIKFSPAGTVVAVEVDCASGSLVEVRVIDRGCGIDPCDIDRVFDRLFQSHEKDAASLGGLGMGLHICKGIVENHGGRICVSSAIGEGSTFTFTLPREGQPSATEVHP